MTPEREPSAAVATPAPDFDFLIRVVDGRWHATATSGRGRRLAADDPRFSGDRVDLSPAEASVLFTELTGRGLFVSLPDGLPERSAGSLPLRLLAALVILTPGAVFLHFLLS